MLRLAARLQVPSAVKAAGQTLLRGAELSPTGRLPWEAVVAAFDIPIISGSSGGGGSDDDEGPSAALAAAAWALRDEACAQLIRELGDLELAWQDLRMRQRLLDLPYEAMRSAHVCVCMCLYVHVHVCAYVCVCT